MLDLFITNVAIFAGAAAVLACLCTLYYEGHRRGYNEGYCDGNVHRPRRY